MTSGPSPAASDRGLGFAPGHGDRHAFAGRQPVRLDHHGNGEAIERRQPVGGALDANIIRRRNSVRPAQILGEALGAFELRRGRARAEHGDPGGAQRVGDPGDQRRFGPDHDQVGGRCPGELDHRRRIARVDGDALGPARDSGIAGRGDQPLAARRLPKAPGERILATARPQEQNIHGPSRRHESRPVSRGGRRRQFAPAQRHRAVGSAQADDRERRSARSACAARFPASSAIPRATATSA